MWMMCVMCLCVLCVPMCLHVCDMYLCGFLCVCVFVCVSLHSGLCLSEMCISVCSMWVVCVYSCDVDLYICDSVCCAFLYVLSICVCLCVSMCGVYVFVCLYLCVLYICHGIFLLFHPTGSLGLSAPSLLLVDILTFSTLPKASCCPSSPQPGLTDQQPFAFAHIDPPKLSI